MKRQTLWIRAAVLLLALISTTMMWADQVTAEQAREQALAFVKNRLTANGRRLAPGAMPQLKQESLINGLYVFNVADNGGFVIVSNDDATIPILGFSDSGHIDADNMPDNMRAWLQGYADEIAWLQKQPTQSRQSARSRAPRQVGSHSTNAIEPLLTTTWNQYEPYNNQCPEYQSGQRSVTGCVATAMAQVMNYHKWPQHVTKVIPAYTTESYGLYVEGLPAIDFDWNNMQNNYTDNEPSAQKTAVAQLMRYCGQAVEMDYGPSSGAGTDTIAGILKKYFDYKETAKFVSRSYYTSAKWADLIYHELNQGRPVIYSGQSSAGGHAFVCDGYKYEGETDFFHINWGWGGWYNEYFVLSALDYEISGADGISSTNGFHYGQDATIGIQPSTGTGTVANITPNDVNLTLKSITTDKEIVAVGEEVKVTLSITNNSPEAYEGDVYINSRLFVDQNSYYDMGYDCNNVFIDPHTTKNIVIPITPTETGFYRLVFYLPGDDGQVYTYSNYEHATIHVYTPVTLTSNATNNSETIAQHDGEKVIVTLDGRTLYKDGNWNTICLPFDVTLANSPLAGATAMALTGATMEESTISLIFNSVTELQAGEPYIIKWATPGNAIENPTFNAVTINKSTARQTIEKASGHVKFIGYYDAFGITPADDYIYYMTAGNMLKHTGIDRTLQACRAYFEFSSTATTRDIVMNFGGNETTAIRDAEANSSLFTLHSSLSGWHTLDGRRLLEEPTKKGIYILNGKKTIIK